MRANSAVLLKIISPVECAAVAKCLGVVDEPALCPTCGCGPEELPAERVTIDYSHGFGVVIPCPECQPERAWAFAVRWRASNAELLDVPMSPYASELICDRPQSGDGRPDPWDLPADELSTTAPLSREVPQFYGRNRGDWDALDDRADVQPFSRTETR